MMEPLPTKPRGFILGELHAAAYRAAVRISEVTKSHGLCCTAGFKGEVPVTDVEVADAMALVLKRSRAKRHRRCLHWVGLLQAMPETVRASLRQVVIAQTDRLARTDLARAQGVATGWKRPTGC